MPGAVVGSSAVTTSNLDEALALFADVAEARLRNLPEADRALERTYLLGSAASPSLAERPWPLRSSREAASWNGCSNMGSKAHSVRRR